jgi:hypothetical protein
MEHRSAPPPTEHTCPLCSRRVLDKELVYFDQGQVVHAACARSGSGTADVVGALLRGAPGQRMCHDCLARRLSLPYQNVRKATTSLRLAEGFLIELGAECADCTRTRVTISFRADLDDA